MIKKIAFVGAPSSGKTTLAARIFAELLEQGVASTGYVQEYAREYIGMKKPFKDIQHQSLITDEQIRREKQTAKCGFNIMLCDSAVWLGNIYLDYRLEMYGKSPEEMEMAEKWDNLYNDYNTLCDQYLKNYDLTVYVPLFTKKSNKNDFRIHDSEQSFEIDEMIVKKLDKVSGTVIKAPKQLKTRRSFIEYICGEIVDELGS